MGTIMASDILSLEPFLDSPNSDPRKRPGVAMVQLAGALELPFVLVGSVLAGGGIGYLLDRSLHTSPGIALGGGFLGFIFGMWQILRQLSKDRKRES
jgi:F0F1-type ATP synthase assembly protein I